MLNQHHQNLSGIEPYIEPLLKRVLQAERLGIYRGVPELLSNTSSCGNSKGDRFKLSIPYAGQNLIWHVYFNSQYPELGPDFVFNDETFLQDPDIDTLSKMVPSLVDWNPNDNNALFYVIVELLLYYKQYQIESLDKYGERLQIEYSTLVGNTQICTQDVEVLLFPLGSKPMEARFMIRMAFDFSKLPAQKGQTQYNEAMLLVIFHAPDWNRITPQLLLSKHLEEALGGRNNLHLPAFPADKYLMDYVPEVMKYITEKINNLVQCYEKRRNFIATMLILKRGSILEYDAADFTQINLLLEHQDFQFFLHCKLPQNFPMHKPVITLQSVYHTTAQGNLYTEEYDDYRYNPRWEPHVMITSLLDCLIENAIQKFQANSIKNSTRF